MKNLILLLMCIFPVVVTAQNRNLDDYFEQAKANSPLIQNSRNEQQLIQLDLDQMNRILLKPEINVESSILFAPIISHDNGANRFQWVSGGANNYTGYDQAATDGGQYQAVVDIRQPLLGKSKLAPYQQKAELSGQINDNRVKLTEHELKQVVSYQYMLCIKSKMQLENRRSILANMRGETATMKKLVGQAIYQQTDLMLLKIETKNYELELKDLEAEYAGNLADLNLLCGIKDTVLAELDPPDFKLGSSRKVLSNFGTSFQLDSLNLAADLKISDLKYRPQLNWFANAGLNATVYPMPNRLGVSTGLTFSWNIFDGHQREIEHQKVAIQLNSLTFEKQNMLTQVDIHKQKILQQIDGVDQRLELIQEQLSQYDQLFTAYSMKLQQGDLSVIELKSLFQDIAAKKQQAIDLKVEKQLLISSYNYWNY